MRLAVNNDGVDGVEYYEYMLLYVDDCLCVSEYPRKALAQIDKYFPMKPGSIGPPKIYLGAKVNKVNLPNGVEAYAVSTSQYVQEAVKNVEKLLAKEGKTLIKTANAPLTSDYRPDECDASPELAPEEATYYQSLIRVVRWMVEMGRIDIATGVSMMSSFVAMPREGHLQQVYHIFAYLKKHHNARLVFDLSYPDLEESDFERNDWTSMYDDASEDVQCAVKCTETFRK